MQDRSISTEDIQIFICLGKYCWKDGRDVTYPHFRKKRQSAVMSISLCKVEEEDWNCFWDSWPPMKLCGWVK